MNKYFRTIDQRTKVQTDDLVIGRLSVLPFYHDTEIDIQALGGTLINSYHQHLYVANIKNWYHDLEDLTFKTYFDISKIPEGKYVLKGETNSKKELWRTHMFAESKKQVTDVLINLQNDSLVGRQQICAREYIPLKTHMIGLNGQPITEEFRFFFCYQQLVAGGYYWASHEEELKDANIIPDASKVPSSLLDEIAHRIGDKINFYVADIAQTEAGDWILVELNDACMSGCSSIQTDDLYRNLEIIVRNKWNQ